MQAEITADGPDVQLCDSGTNARRQYLTFTLGGETYGIEILRVQEIRGWGDVRALPSMPPYMKGVLDLRGTIVPIIDLRERFKLEIVTYDGLTVIIIVRFETGQGERVMGLVVDCVSDVLNANGNDVRSPPDMGAGINTRYISGIHSNEDNMIVILNTDSLLGVDELDTVYEGCR